MLSRINPNQKEPQAICIAPTRELARQIHDVATKLAQFMENITITLIIPEKDRIPIGRKLLSQIIIGTPGRLVNLIDKQIISTQNLKIIVFDEADEMMKEQSAQIQTERILKAVRRFNTNIQICLFSATFSDNVKNFADKNIQGQKLRVHIPVEKLSLDSLLQVYINCGDENYKLVILHEFYGVAVVGQSIIFTQTRRKAREVFEYLTKNGHEVSMLTGSDDIQIRDQVIDAFRAGNSRVLVTTNLLSRGVDVLSVSLVINFDVPETKFGAPDFESYLHRIGRSARYGKSGLAINLVHDDRTLKILKDIEEHFSHPIREVRSDELHKFDQIMEDLKLDYS